MIFSILPFLYRDKAIIESKFYECNIKRNNTRRHIFSIVDVAGAVRREVTWKAGINNICCPGDLIKSRRRSADRCRVCACFENLYIVNFFGFLDKESLLRGKATRAGRYLADIQVLRMYRNFFCIATKAVDGNIWLRWITLLDHRRQFPVQSNNKGSPVTAMPPRMVIQSSFCVVTFLHMLPFVSGRSSKPKQFRRNTPRKKVYRTIF